MTARKIEGYTRRELMDWVAELRVENERLKSDRWIVDDTDLSAMTGLSGQLESAQGYWRLGRAADGNYWARFKWTQGNYRGSYVMGSHNTLARAILNCETDIMKVEQGKRSPLIDKGYRNIVK